ncbi:DUF3106 domain-containing protein [Uliginosibacterium gangwonense]|uniref:DUF3106 domain-containing protein n=1 Tax=Uliginosibacterium gangwonense TaxID=392736 RepID=UPI0003773F8A|nr:DUF3106 domain-containing protein [Uliginosibacterium gangwonense]
MAFKRPAATLIACLLLQALPVLAAPTLTAQPAWNQLTANQRAVLAPLAPEWNGFSDDGKLKWLGIADRYKSMTPVEQTRLQERMKEWVALSPAEREKARSQYLRLRTAPADQRRALEQRWQEYDALSGDEKKRLKETRPSPPQPASSQPATAPRQAPPKSVLMAPPNSKPEPIKPQ